MRLTFEISRGIMRFGVNFFPVLEPRDCLAADYYQRSLDLVEQAEQLGFEHAQIVEHHFTPYGGYSPDPVTFLAAAATRTSRIRIVTGAVIPAFTHPIAVAERLAMLDHLSKGRLDVGFGRGFLPDEFAAFGVSMDTSKARFVEAVEVCRRLWTETDVVHRGRFHQFGPVTVLPRPYQRPCPPIFIAAATSAESCAEAGSQGYHLQVVPSVTSAEQLRDMLEAYRGAWESAGHRPGGHRIQIKYSCYVARDRAQAHAEARRHENAYVVQMARAVSSLASGNRTDYPGYESFAEKAANYDFDRALAADKVLAGDPRQIRDQIARLGEMFGRDLTVSLQFNPGTTEIARSKESMHLFSSEVAPEFEEIADGIDQEMSVG
jgi:alkanesulfonate monooxygenase SsuD/methylene tetrahydromethanopterin reductase-like flavin-dependent oxidoreductase (luciferase family)